MFQPPELLLAQHIDQSTVKLIDAFLTIEYVG